jgi:hypothetical protein
MSVTVENDNSSRTIQFMSDNTVNTISGDGLPQNWMIVLSHNGRLYRGGRPLRGGGA